MNVLKNDRESGVASNPPSDSIVTFDWHERNSLFEWNMSVKHARGPEVSFFPMDPQHAKSLTLPCLNHNSLAACNQDTYPTFQHSAKKKEEELISIYL